MIKTLRITSIVAAALAVVFLVSSVVFGVRGNAEIEEFLSSQSVVDRFKEAGQKNPNASNNAVSPLVAKAEAYKNIIDPPKPEIQVPRNPHPTAPVVSKPVAPAAKFKLIGISYYEAKPSESLAFIDEVGKGAHWVRPNSSIGHLKIESIEEDKIVVNDGQKSFDMSPDTAAVASAAPAIGSAAPVRPTPAIASPTTMRTSPAAARTASTRPPTTARPTTRTAPSVSPEQAAKMEALVEQLKNMQRTVNKDKTGGTAPDSQAMMERLMSGVSSRVTEDEAENLGDLGEELNNQANAPGTKTPPRPPVSRPAR